MSYYFFIFASPAVEPLRGSGRTAMNGTPTNQLTESNRKTKSPGRAASSIWLRILTVLKGLRDNLIYRPQSTDALITAGQHALFWTDNFDTSAAQDRDIVCVGCMKPHITSQC